MTLLSDDISHRVPAAPRPPGPAGWPLIGSAASLLKDPLGFSEQVRRRAKVFVNKHFYAQKYDYRQEWLQFSENLSRGRSAGIDEFAVGALK